MGAGAGVLVADGRPVGGVTVTVLPVVVLPAGVVPGSPDGPAVAGVVPAGSAAARAAGPASSMITCALVPLTPNDDTAARRGRPDRSGHATGSVSSRAFPALQSTCRDGAST